MRNKIIFALVVVGVLGALGSAYVYAVPSKPLPPVFNPAPESVRAGDLRQRDHRELPGERREHQHLPRGGGRSCAILVTEGQQVTQGHAARQIDDSIQRATVSSRSPRRRPRRRCSRSSRRSRARRTSRSRARRSSWPGEPQDARDTLDKQQSSYKLDPVGQQGRARQRDQRAEGRKGEPRRGHAPVRADQGRRLGVRHPRTRRSSRGARQGLRGLERAAREVHPQGPGRRRRHVDRRRGRLRLAAGRLRHVHAGVRPGRRDGHVEGHPGVRCYIDEILIPRLPRRQAAGADVHPRHEPRRSRSSSFACSRTSRRRSSSRTSGRRRSTCGCCPSSSASSRRRACRCFPASSSTSTSGRSDVRKRSAALVLSSARQCAGCAVGPDFHRPARPDRRKLHAEPAQRRRRRRKGQRFVEGQPVAGDWWRLLRCPALDSIVDQALAANPGLEAARATLRQNQDSLRAGYGVFFPQVDARGQRSAESSTIPPRVSSRAARSTSSRSRVPSATRIDIWGGSPAGRRSSGRRRRAAIRARRARDAHEQRRRRRHCAGRVSR
jgi:hypothetical protein